MVISIIFTFYFLFYFYCDIDQLTYGIRHLAKAMTIENESYPLSNRFPIEEQSGA